MSRRTRGLLLSAVGLAVAGVLGWTWLQSHGTQLQTGPGAIPWVGGLALACLAGAVGLQIIRTGLLLHTRPTRLARPLLLAHGLNIWLPSMMGDLFEVWAVAAVAGRSKRGTLVLLGHRFAGTLAALGILAAVALAARHPSLAISVGVASVGSYLALDATVGWWVRWLRVPDPGVEAKPTPLGPRRTLAHLGLAVVQHGVEALGIFLLGMALGAAVSPGGAAGVVSIIELVTYLPIPVGGAGANHWGASTVLEWSTPGRNTGLLVAGAHGLHVGLGALAIGLGSLLPRDASAQNTA